MTHAASFALLLEILDGVLDESPLTRRGDQPLDAQERAVIDHLRGNPEAQVTLLLLAWELKAESVDDTGRLQTELRTFATIIKDRFGVDLLRTAAAHPSRLPPDFPAERLLPAGEGRWTSGSTG
jgi:hypothetical protein